MRSRQLFNTAGFVGTGWLLAALVSGTCVAAAQDYIPPKIDSTTPTGVNLAEGSFIYTVTDISMGSLKLERSHIGGLEDPNDPFFGPRMTHNFDIYVAKNLRGAVPPFIPMRYKPIVHMGRSASGTYVHEMYVNPTVLPSDRDAASGILSYQNDIYKYIAGDGTVYLFSATVPVRNAKGGGGSRRIASISFPDGRVQNFSYNANGDLKLVTDTSGYALVFDYGSVGRVSAACGYNLAVTYVTASTTCTSAAIKTAYGYTSSRLTSSTDVVGQVTTYAYNGDRMSC